MLDQDFKRNMIVFEGLLYTVVEEDGVPSVKLFCSVDREHDAIWRCEG